MDIGDNTKPSVTGPITVWSMDGFVLFTRLVTIFETVDIYISTFVRNFSFNFCVFSHFDSSFFKQANSTSVSTLIESSKQPVLKISFLENFTFFDKRNIWHIVQGQSYQFFRLIP